MVGSQQKKYRRNKKDWEEEDGSTPGIWAQCFFHKHIFSGKQVA